MKSHHLPPPELRELGSSIVAPSTGSAAKQRAYGLIQAYVVLGKALRVLPETKHLEPVSDASLCGCADLHARQQAKEVFAETSLVRLPPASDPASYQASVEARQCSWPCIAGLLLFGSPRPPACGRQSTTSLECWRAIAVSPGLLVRCRRRSAIWAKSGYSERRCCRYLENPSAIASSRCF
jgi:hypothetical protein